MWRLGIIPIFGIILSYSSHNKSNFLIAFFFMDLHLSYFIHFFGIFFCCIRHFATLIVYSTSSTEQLNLCPRATGGMTGKIYFSTYKAFTSQSRYNFHGVQSTTIITTCTDQFNPCFELCYNEDIIYVCVIVSISTVLFGRSICL